MTDSPERVSDEQTPPKRGIKTEMVVAISAIVVSIMTLFVYIFQARIMMDQQHTSVWPYVEWSSTKYNSDTQEFYFEVVNKGVGPAIVKNSTLTLDGKTYNDYHEMMIALLGQAKHDSLWIMYSVVNDRVLAPGESVKIFHVKNWRDARIPDIELNRFSYTICYCSIYDDCWTTQGSISTESDCK